jgi:3-oxoadipate enol-lactonase
MLPKVSRVTMRFSVNGTRYAADLRGSGPAIVALHAGIATRHMYAALLAGLEVDHLVLAYDQPGFGESELPAGPIAPEHEVFSLMDRAGIDKAVLVGTSYGCRVAFDAALALPDRVQGIVAAGAGLSGRKPPSSLQEAFREVDRLFDTGDLDGANELEMRIWIDGVGRTRPLDPAVRASAARMNRTILEEAASGR